MLAKIKCRVCQEEMNEQSYREHLRRKHKNEDELDRRVWGQQKLNLFGKKKDKKDVAEEVDENKNNQAEGGETDDLLLLVEDGDKGDEYMEEEDVFGDQLSSQRGGVTRMRSRGSCSGD